MNTQDDREKLQRLQRILPEEAIQYWHMKNMREGWTLQRMMEVEARIGKANVLCINLFWVLVLSSAVAFVWMISTGGYAGWKLCIPFVLILGVGYAANRWRKRSTRMRDTLRFTLGSFSSGSRLIPPGYDENKDGRLTVGVIIHSLVISAWHVRQAEMMFDEIRLAPERQLDKIIRSGNEVSRCSQKFEELWMTARMFGIGGEKVCKKYIFEKAEALKPTFRRRGV